jgi:hypothetical protein
MRHTHWQVLAIVAMVSTAAGCSVTQASEAIYEKPATIDTIPGSALKTITLTSQAVERLGVETAIVTEGADGKVIPYAAVIYLPDGTTWAYTNPAGRTFVRAELTVKEIRGDEALLSDGPDVGTVVATVGVAELFGAENKVGK